MSAEVFNDAELVSESLSGNRDAFGRIVAQYQSLICSLAYCVTGSLSQSEDLAQETFLAAWKQLADLREPHKLRAWLCGIARNLISYSSGPAFPVGYREARFVQVLVSHIAMPRSLLRGYLLFVGRCQGSGLTGCGNASRCVN
jgi:hypothetical protein